MPTICVIEDDEGIQDILKIIFRHAGYETIIFDDPVAILAKNFSPVDLFLIDKQLKGFDGLNLCEFLKVHEETSQVPVILMSAYPNMRELAMSAGADGFIEKPFSISTLLKMVESELQKRVEKVPN